MKGFPLSSCIFISTSRVCFAVTKTPYENSTYLSVSTNKPGVKSEISGVMWQVAPESKIKLVSCKLSPKSHPWISALKYIRAIYAYIFCDLLWSVLFTNVLSIFVDLYLQVLGFSMFHWTFLSEVFGFGKFAMKWSSDPHLKQVSGFRPLRSLRLLLELRELKSPFLYPFYFIYLLKRFTAGCEPQQWLHLDLEKTPLLLFAAVLYKLK